MWKAWYRSLFAVKVAERPHGENAPRVQGTAGRYDSCMACRAEAPQAGQEEALRKGAQAVSQLQNHRAV